MRSEGNSGAVLPSADAPTGPSGEALEFFWVQSALGVVTWIWDIENDQVYWFGDVSPLLGLPAGTFPGNFESYLGYLHPGDRDAARGVYLDCLKGVRPSYRCEERVIWPDGSLHWLETYGKAEYRPSGRAYRIAGVIKDVTDRKEIEAALVQSEERFAKVFRSCPAAIVVTRLSDGLILNANPHFEEITAHQASNVIGRTTSEIGLWVDTAERDRWVEQLDRRGVVRDFPARFNTRDGRIITVLMSSSRLDLDGEPGAISLSRNVTEQAQAQRKALDSQRKYATIFEISPEAMAITLEEGGQIIEVNSALIEQLGRSREEILGHTGHEIGLWAEVRDRDRVLELLKRDGQVSNFDTRFVHADGTTLDILISCSRLHVEERPCVVWTWRNLTEIRAVERTRAESERAYRGDLERLANEDPLTGLPNRNWLMGQLAAAVQTAASQDERFAILFIDFDGFKKINDSIGHAIGDELLQAAARRLEQALRPGDRVARIGGDEFTVLLGRLEDESEAVSVASRMVEAFQKPFQLSNYELRIGISIGISLYPKDGRDGDALLRSADIAMYEAKSSGRGRYHFYTDALFQRLTARLETERALDGALVRNEFSMYYQPRISATDGRLVGFEALLRWHNPQRGLVYPGSFISLAEETGLIVKIGERVIELVCAQLAAWTQAGVALVPVSVNVSPQEFQRAELVECIEACLARYDLPATLIEIEITESSTLGPHFDAPRRLHELHELGLKVLIDDFGTGYSSLSQLQKLDVDILKIDQSFTAELGTSRHGEILVRTIIEMAKALGMIVVAEGVETLEQFRTLRELGCDEIQGYLISRPVPATEVPAFLGQILLPAAL